ncbi:hypothetical protein BC335_1397 [Lactobacillus helveticus]|uniref:DUF4767 domain-containing protein n=1 Tax=Lactobacillus helveticus TaxID=1587 RepID=A0A386RFR6_LACHE|nr:DUF4767 domain-containing protein [Lactobacillus helveticus]AYE61829.1 hypothetical protein BC335_1397 [Lactobacillus helveticus]MCD9225208.1 DUF4767 domain-containing protein [Lactobacillus helveticus]
MTTLTGCSQIHFGKDAVTIGNVKKEKSTKAKIKKAQSSSKKTAPKKKKVVKKKIVSKWDIKKTQKLQKAVNQWGKAIGQSYPDVLKKNRFLLNKKIIKIGYSLLGKNDYQYNVVAIANENFKSWHNTYLFCLMKDKPVILLDQSKNANPVMVKVVKGKKLNKDFSKIYTEK